MFATGSKDHDIGKILGGVRDMRDDAQRVRPQLIP
jgi:hypothetical protein